MNIQLITTDQEVLAVEPQLIQTYKQVFGDRIWKEGMRGTDCSYKTAFQDVPADNRCETPACNCALEEFYKDADVADMLRLLVKERFTMTLAWDQERLVGFFWGWDDALENLQRKKLQISEEYLPVVEDWAWPIKRMFYFAETGVVENMRGQGVATQLYDAALESRQKLVPYVLLCRTCPDSPQWKLCKKRGYTPIYDYEDEQKRALFIQQII